jgi:hypothetical protein
LKTVVDPRNTGLEEVMDGFSRTRRLFKKARFLTRPILAVISPARPESAKTDSSPWDASCPMQGRSE